MPRETSVSVLIRADLTPVLQQLYGVYSAVAELAGPHNAYEAYLHDLYGDPGTDWLMVWNYGLLVSLTALVGLLLMFLTGQVS